MHKLVLIRHGESVWNKENIFTGWSDVDLSENGVEEAKKAGQMLKKHGFEFDITYTSYLKRAIRTLWIVLEEMDALWLPVEKSWRLNERHYGALQGLNKQQVAEKEGEEQVHIWRRSYNIQPPALKKDDPRYAGNEKKYHHLKENEIPLTESLEDTVERFLPFWEQAIAPSIRVGKNVLIAAHGNSLRALIKHLDNVSDDKITELNIPTAKPLVYELDENLKPIKSYYLED